MNAMHIYQRKINADGADSLSRIALSIPPSVELLDVGTGTGALGEFLSSQRECILDGVNYNADEVAIAKPFYRELRVANLEQTRLSELFGKNRYDFIVFADVLEHLRNPADILADARKLLKLQGRIIISLPNIAYAGVIADLLAGQFNYTEEGILDQTHVQFFTRNSLHRLLSKCGLKPTHWDQISRQPGDSEFRHRYPDALSPTLWGALSAHPDALTYQFIVEAASNDASISEAPMPPALAPEFGFMVQAYWSATADAFNEAASVKAFAHLGSKHQTVTLPLELTGRGYLRIDPADRPGTMKLWALRIIDSNGVSLWEWRGRSEEFAASSGLLAIANGFNETGVTLALLDNDPNILFALGDMTLPPDCSLELKLSWPASNDSLALSHAYQQWTDHLMQQAQAQNNALEQALLAAQGFVYAREQDIQSLREQLQLQAANLQLQNSERQNMMQLLQENKQQQLKQIEQFQVVAAEKSALMEQFQTVSAEKSALAEELQRMKQSRSWRYTRFLRKE